MVATDVVTEVQAAALLRSWVDPSESVPVAVNCWVVPFGIDGFAGVTAIETSAGGPTVKVVLPETPADVALMVVVPCCSAAAEPPASTVATVDSDDAQVTE